MSTSPKTKSRIGWWRGDYYCFGEVSHRHYVYGTKRQADSQLDDADYRVYPINMPPAEWLKEAIKDAEDELKSTQIWLDRIKESLSAVAGGAVPDPLPAPPPHDRAHWKKHLVEWLNTFRGKSVADLRAAMKVEHLFHFSDPDPRCFIVTPDVEEGGGMIRAAITLAKGCKTVEADAKASWVASDYWV